MTPLLNDAEINDSLQSLPDWRYEKGALVANLRFKSFMDAMAFMNTCATYCEEHDHHPMWTNTYRNLDISLMTHDAGGKVTQKDVELAKFMSGVFGE